MQTNGRAAIQYVFVVCLKLIQNTIYSSKHIITNCWQNCKPSSQRKQKVPSRRPVQTNGMDTAAVRANDDSNTQYEPEIVHTISLVLTTAFCHQQFAMTAVTIMTET